MMQMTTRLRQRLLMWGVSVVAALGASAAHAQASIESVTGFLQGGVEVLRIDLSAPIAEPPTGFVVQTPARIALDFPDVANGTGKSKVDINQGNIRTGHSGIIHFFFPGFCFFLQNPRELHTGQRCPCGH